MPEIYKKAPIQYYEKPIVHKTEPKQLRRKTKLNYKNFSIYVIPTILFGIGSYILISQIIPTAKFLVEQKFSPKYAEIASPVPENSSLAIENVALSGKFEAQYFFDLFEALNKKEGNVAGARAPYKSEWIGFFTISIPSVGVDKMRVTANVDSYEESVYGEVLKNSLAHFKGTDLPANDEYDADTNTFIYGHSAPSSWASLHKNSFEAAFNPLFDLNIGDKIIVNFQGEELSYTVARIKVTKPDDMNALQGIEGRKILTLMTCAPPGSSTNRLNIIATLD